MTNFKKLFEPALIGSVEIKNRIVMSPTSPNYAGPDGSVTPRLIRYYTRRAEGGAGLIITGWSFIDGEASREVGAQIGVHEERMIPGLNSLTEEVHSCQAKIFLQVSYLGRKIAGKIKSKVDIASFELGLSEESYSPLELGFKDIAAIVKMFVRAARRAKVAGFDGLEISAAPGELLCSFMMKQSNKREDKYGGKLENRLRLLVEIIAGIKASTGDDFPVGVRFSGVEDHSYLNGKALPNLYSPSLTEALEIALLLEKSGVDYLNILRLMTPMYVTDRDFTTAAALKRKLGIPIIATGAILDPSQGEMVLSENKADFVALARALIADPDWPLKSREGRTEEICKCIRCNECILRGFKVLPVKCTVNVVVGKEFETELKPARIEKKVAVIGGGPAGMEASLTAAERGHDVTLFEEDNFLGGHLIPGSRPPFKKDLTALLEHFVRRIKKSSVTLNLGKKIGDDTIKHKDFDAIVVATGSDPKPLDVPVKTSAKQFTSIEALNAPETVGERVAVVGAGATGCEVSVFLSNMGKRVQLLEAGDEILMDLEVDFNKIDLRRMLNQAGIKPKTGVKIEEIDDKGVLISTRRKRSLVPADSVIVSIGLKANRNLYDSLKQKCQEIHRIGDSKTPRRLYHAIHEGHQIGALT